MKNFNIDESQIENYKTEFKKTGSVFLPSLLKQNTLKNLLTKLGNTDFITKYEMKEENKFGKVLFVPIDNPIIFTFQFLFNDQNFFSILEHITDCKPIGNFVGRIHQSKGGEEHKIEWHDDNSDTRLLAMTLCLSEDIYTGAKLQIREVSNGNLTAEYGQLAPGDAVIFKISPDFQHRLTSIETGTRTVGVGWFRNEPDFKTFTNMLLKPF